MRSRKKSSELVCISGQYIVPHWTKHPTTMSFIDSSPCFGGGGSSPKSNRQELWREIYACVGLGGNNAYRMSRMAQVPQEMKVELLLDSNGHEQVKGNKSAIAQKQRLLRCMPDVMGFGIF
nr:protein FAR1-RELATED SEQUENCE 5-like [Ipomoea batatas]